MARRRYLVVRSHARVRLRSAFNNHSFVTDDHRVIVSRARVLPKCFRTKPHNSTRDMASRGDNDDYGDDDDNIDVGENRFINDGYVEPTMADDEAFRWCPTHAPNTAAAALLTAKSHTTSNDGAYNTSIAVSCDGTRVGVVTTSGRVHVYDRDETGATHEAFVVDVGRGVNECAFASSADPHVFALACNDGTCKVYDGRMGTSSPVAVYRAPFNVEDVESCALGGDASDALLAVAVGPHIAFYDRRSTSTAPLTVFQDAHSETVTCVRFHPERRSNLYTASVDGLVCAFNCEAASGGFNDEDALISIMSTDAAVNNIGFCRTGASSGTEHDAVWCTTGIEEVHIFVAGGDPRRVGVPLAHVANAREAAQRVSAASAPDFASQVDYIIGVHDGVAPGELYVSAGTQSGAIGVFPVVRGAPAAIGTPGYVTLDAPVAILRNGHRDIVRSMYWDANAAMSEASRVPLTCGEDSLVCSWRPSVETDGGPVHVDRARPPGRRHSPY